jgi:myb proto-oncogene protein
LDPDNGKKAVKWTLAEDAKVIEAVTKHSTDWVAVAALVPGRTNLQCRDRWVNTLDPANDIEMNTAYWTPEEDTKMIEVVKKHGTAWVAVAALVPGRTNLQCRDRWVNTLDPANDIEMNTAYWTPEEDIKMIEVVKKHGTAWVAVAALVPGRTSI